jgi:hypothetical protein
MLEEMGNIIKTAATDGTQASQSRLHVFNTNNAFQVRIILGNS